MKILISNRGEIFSIEAESFETIENIKSKIFDKTQIDQRFQILLFKGKALDDKKSISFYNMVNGSTLYLLINEVLLNYEVNFYIKEKSGDFDFSAKYKPFELVETIKKEVYEKKIYKMHPVEEIRLFYNEQELDDNKTLFSYGFKDSNTKYEIIIFYGPKNGGLIKVEGNYGVIDTFYMPFSSTIEEIKEKIYHKIYFDIDCQRLFNKDNIELENKKTLSNYNINKNAVLNLILESKNGINIFIRNYCERTRILEVKESDNILSVKTKIASSIYMKEGYLDLFFNDKKLEDDKSLSDYNIKNESTLYLKFNEKIEPNNKLFVKSLTGKTTMLPVNPAYSIEIVKLLMFEKEGIPTDQQRLVFCGRQLSDNLTLDEYKIENKDTISLILRLRGG